MFGIKSVNSDDGVAEVGYCLAGDVQGRGIIATIINAMSPYLETELGARILEFRCLDANQASMNIALRAGAVLTQIIPGFMMLNGTSHNLNIYQVRLSND